MGRRADSRMSATEVGTSVASPVAGAVSVDLLARAAARMSARFILEGSTFAGAAAGAAFLGDAAGEGFAAGAAAYEAGLPVRAAARMSATDIFLASAAVAGDHGRLGVAIAELLAELQGLVPGPLGCGGEPCILARRQIERHRQGCHGRGALRQRAG